MASLGPSSLYFGVSLTRRGVSEARAGALNISTLRPGICNVDGSRPSLKKLWSVGCLDRRSGRHWETLLMLSCRCPHRLLTHPVYRSPELSRKKAWRTVKPNHLLG